MEKSELTRNPAQTRLIDEIRAEVKKLREENRLAYHADLMERAADQLERIYYQRRQTPNSSH